MSEINHHKEHRKRLKNRFLSEGLDNFEVHNVLELLLFFGIPQKDTNDLAHELLNKFGSLSGVFEAPYSELIKVKGIGDNAATLIQLIYRCRSQHSCPRQQCRGNCWDSPPELAEEARWWHSRGSCRF